MSSRTFLTKWGRLTGQQWILARFNEALDEWWTPGLAAYLEENWPTPEELQQRSRWRQQQERRLRTAKAIADCARVDRASPGSGYRPRPTAPAHQLTIL